VASAAWLQRGSIYLDFLSACPEDKEEKGGVSDMEKGAPSLTGLT
jgi:hypothetical protein